MKRTERKDRKMREEVREKEEAAQLEQFKELKSKNNTINKPGHVTSDIISAFRKRKRTQDDLTVDGT